MVLFLYLFSFFLFFNVNRFAYCLLEWFIYSWISSVLGSITVFLVIRKLGYKRIFQKIRKNKTVLQVTNWVEYHGFGPLFILLCFPFSPSSVINVVAGISKVSKLQFFLAVILGKSIMIFSMAYVGSSVMEFAKSPIRTTIILVSIVIFWSFGKYIEGKMKQKKADKKF